MVSGSQDCTIKLWSLKSLSKWKQARYITLRVTPAILYRDLYRKFSDDGWGSHFFHIHMYTILLKFNGKNPGGISLGPPLYKTLLYII